MSSYINAAHTFDNKTNAIVTLYKFRLKK